MTCGWPVKLLRGAPVGIVSQSGAPLCPGGASGLFEPGRAWRTTRPAEEVRSRPVPAASAVAASGGDAAAFYGPAGGILGQIRRLDRVQLVGGDGFRLARW